MESKLRGAHVPIGAPFLLRSMDARRVRHFSKNSETMLLGHQEDGIPTSHKARLASPRLPQAWVSSPRGPRVSPAPRRPESRLPGESCASGSPCLRNAFVPTRDLRYIENPIPDSPRFRLKRDRSGTLRGNLLVVFRVIRASHRHSRWRASSRVDSADLIRQGNLPETRIWAILGGLKRAERNRTRLDDSASH